MTKLKCTEQQVLEAITASRGIKTAIARKLKVSRWTVDEYLRRWPSCQQAYDDECETLLDQAEGKLYEKAIVEGSECSLHFLLATKGKSRGYVRASKHEVTGKDGGPVEVSSLAVDPRDLDAETLRALARARQKRLPTSTDD